MTHALRDPGRARPTVAVIIPAFQAESTLGAALASVAAQSALPEEVVVGDDGSSDGTVAIARAWESHLPMRVVRTPQNLGPAGARNAAIAESSSSLLALLDADDYWLPDHLDAMVEVHASTLDGLASADSVLWIPGQAVGTRPLSHAAPLPRSGAQLRWLLARNRLSVAALFSRARYEEVGGFRIEFRGTEDWDLWIRMVRAGATVVRPQHPTVVYRLRADGVSSDALLPARRAVLETAAKEVSRVGARSERRAIRTGFRLLTAEAHLQDSYASARSGQRLTARVAGMRAMVGVRPVAARGLAMALVPAWTTRRRDMVHQQPDIWLRRYGSAS